MSGNSVDPDQTPHYVASDLGLHCLSMILFGFPGKGWINKKVLTILIASEKGFHL